MNRFIWSNSNNPESEITLEHEASRRSADHGPPVANHFCRLRSINWRTLTRTTGVSVREVENVSTQMHSFKPSHRWYVRSPLCPWRAQWKFLVQCKEAKRRRLVHCKYLPFYSSGTRFESWPKYFVYSQTSHSTTGIVCRNRPGRNSYKIFQVL
jgi:hypothetical protein